MDLAPLEALWSVQCAAIGFSALMIWLVYRLFFAPIELTTEWHEVGYTYSKKTAANVIKMPKAIGKVPPVYPNGWFVIAESLEVEKEKVIPVSALGENLAVFRDSAGICHALNAYCPHLGANMAIGGVVEGDCLKCPFHHWSFSGSDGRCVKIPFSSKVPNLAVVKSWRVKETNGLIFLWYHAENEPPTWEPLPIGVVQNASFAYKGKNVHFVNSHIQDIPENGADLWHFAPLHGAPFLVGPDLYSDGNALWRWLSSAFRHEWTAEWDTDVTFKHVSRSRLIQTIVAFERFSFLSLDLQIQQLGPGYVVMDVKSSFGPMIIVQTVTPIKPLTHKVVNRVYCPVYLSLIGLFVLIGEKIMIERDIAVWNHKTFLENPIILKEDKAIVKYRRWFGQFYSENSKTYAQAVEEYDW